MTQPLRHLDDHALVERAITCSAAQQPAPARGPGLGADDVRRRIASTSAQLGADSDLSSPDQLQSHGVVLNTQSPDGFRRALVGMHLTWGLGGTPFGPALLVSAPKGICLLAFIDAPVTDKLGDSLAARWPQALLQRDDTAVSAALQRLFRHPADARPGPRLWLAGSDFQVQVWRALLRIPRGGLLSYGRLAALLGRPRAARAVGSAVARNPVAWLIPCHRVVRENGDIGHYHWGQRRKQAICAWEAATGP